jgi:hypothetical protein
MFWFFCLAGELRWTLVKGLTVSQAATAHTWKGGGQRPILNFVPRSKLSPQGVVVPQGWILSPGAGWSYPMGVKFSVCTSILLNIRECSPLGVNKGVNIPPRGQISPLLHFFRFWRLSDYLHCWHEVFYDNFKPKLKELNFSIRQMLKFPTKW